MATKSRHFKIEISMLIPGFVVVLGDMFKSQIQEVSLHGDSSEMFFFFENSDNILKTW